MASKTFHPLARSTYATQCAAEQEPTVPISTAMLMRHENFRRGVEDVRAGRRPRFDDLNDDGGPMNEEDSSPTSHRSPCIFESTAS
jgi:hypothetical protein